MLSLHQIEYTFIIALSHKYVIKMAFVFQVIISLNQLEYTFIIA